jgi:segregation and condensation protein B
MADEETQISAEVVRALEGILLVAMEHVDPTLLAQLLEQPVSVVEGLCERLSMAYAEAGHGFQLVKVAGGYRFQSHPDVSAYVERFVLDSQQARISSAALETLAIIAYKQPLSRQQVASIRGVDPDAVMRTLQARWLRCHRLPILYRLPKLLRPSNKDSELFQPIQWVQVETKLRGNY